MRGPGALVGRRGVGGEVLRGLVFGFGSGFGRGLRGGCWLLPLRVAGVQIDEEPGRRVSSFCLGVEGRMMEGGAGVRTIGCTARRTAASSLRERKAAGGLVVVQRTWMNVDWVCVVEV
jgi:hypothetical protein